MKNNRSSPCFHVAYIPVRVGGKGRPIPNRSTYGVADNSDYYGEKQDRVQGDRDARGWGWGGEGLLLRLGGSEEVSRKKWHVKMDLQASRVGRGQLHSLEQPAPSCWFQTQVPCIIV